MRRAKFIVGSVAALHDADGGGATWLLDLRSKPYAEATEALEKLPGIGPKVYFILFCFVLFCFVLFCFVLFCFVLFCFVLFCFVLFCFVLSY